MRERRVAGIWPIRLVFFMEAATIGAWLPRIPDIRADLGLSEGGLGLALVGMPAGSLIGFVFAARVVSMLGLRRACAIAGALFALAFMPLALADSGLAMFAVLFLSGLVVAFIEVAMSSKAGQVEAATGRRIMSGCHGFWSIGVVAGSLLGGAFAQAGIAPAVQFTVLNPLLAAVAFGVGAAMTPDTAVARPGEVGFIVLPPRSLLLLCLLPMGIMALEGSVIDWSAVFVRDVLMGQPFEASLAYAAFAGAMAVLRLTGDALAERFGVYRVVLVASLTAAVGAALFATASSLPVLLVAAALMGAGGGPVYPLAMSVAAAAPGQSAEANVAAMSFISFAVFLASPPLMGGLAQAFDLRVAFAVLVPAALLSAALAGAIRRFDGKAP